MEPSTTRIISIASGKGGVGKTSVAVNLAWALADRRLDVCLLDADLGLANVDILLGLTPTITLEHVLFEKAPIEKATLRVGNKIDVINGSSGVSRMTELTRRRRSQLLNEFEKLNHYDFLLIDNSPGISASVIALCLSSHGLIVVINPEATSLIDSYALIKVLKENGLWATPLILVNRVKGPRKARAVFERLRNATKKFLNLDCNYLGWIAEDEAISDAISKQKPIMEVYPDAAASLCFNALSARLDEKWHSKRQSVTPGHFWDQSVMLTQQGPRLGDMLAEQSEQRARPEVDTVAEPDFAYQGRNLDNVIQMVEEAFGAEDDFALRSILLDIQNALTDMKQSYPAYAESREAQEVPGKGADDATTYAEPDHERPEVIVSSDAEVQEIPEERADDATMYAEPDHERPEVIVSSDTKDLERADMVSSASTGVYPEQETARGKIVVLSTENEMYFLLKEIVEEMGFEAFEWTEAIELFERDSYVLAIVNKGRSDADVKRIIPSLKNIPLLMISEWGIGSDLELQLESVVWDTINKPFSLEELQTKIVELVER